MKRCPNCMKLVKRRIANTSNCAKKKRLVDGYIRAVGVMYRTATTQELRQYGFLHYEKLAHDPRSSIRIVNGMVERLLFTETDDGIEVELIEIDSTHYGNKK